MMVNERAAGEASKASEATCDDDSTVQQKTTNNPRQNIASLCYMCAMGLSINYIMQTIQSPTSTTQGRDQQMHVGLS